MKRISVTLALVVSAAVLGACGTTDNSNRMFGQSMTDQKFGDSVREARLRQTIDLEAGSKNPAYVGTDGNTAAHTMKRYNESFKEPQPTINVLGIGDRNR